jgi:aspartyl protease family protein
LAEASRYIPGMDENNQPAGRSPFWLWLLIGAIGVAVLIYVLDSQFPGVLSDGNTQPRIAYSAILLVVLVSALFAGRRIPAGTALRYAVVWIAIGAGLILAYSFRSDFQNAGNRIMGELRPDKALISGNGDVTIRRGRNGHFNLTAEVDGVSIRFLVDTGASLVALSPGDARAVGFDLDRLTYGIRTRTANGIAYVAPVSLGSIAAGPIVARDVEATVSRDGLSESLLGLSFLNRLSGYEVRGDTMILKP